MIVRKRCPHTGVVNFYFDSEPYLPVGSVSLCGTSAQNSSYTWRSYGDDFDADALTAGRARDARTAERNLLDSLAHLTRVPEAALAI
ncbi:MAG: hypothetical protein ABL898_00915 [Hyphomicrobiaceae bacterium]